MGKKAEPLKQFKNKKSRKQFFTFIFLELSFKIEVLMPLLSELPLAFSVIKHVIKIFKIVGVLVNLHGIDRKMIGFCIKGFNAD